MGLYEELNFVDILEPIRPVLDTGQLEWDPEKRKIVIPSKLRWSYPWIMGKTPMDRVCAVWLEFYFKYYKVFPKECRGCWKVVARTRKVRDVLRIMKLQKKQDIPGKCGMENRSYTPGAVFGAYWYLPLGIGEGEAVALKREIERDLAREVGFGIPVIVKRSCTEMEAYFGPSTEWKNLDFGSNDMKQEMLDALFEYKKVDYPQPGALVTHIQKQWIERAWREGDETVWEFAEKESFPLAPVDYDEGGVG